MGMVWVWSMSCTATTTSSVTSCDSRSTWAASCASSGASCSTASKTSSSSSSCSAPALLHVASTSIRRGGGGGCLIKTRSACSTGLENEGPVQNSPHVSLIKIVSRKTSSEKIFENAPRRDQPYICIYMCKYIYMFIFKSQRH